MDFKSFGEFLECPICATDYDGLIYQCEKGHSFCNSCNRKLTDCPYCCAALKGTRNYVLEEMVQSKLSKDSECEDGVKSKNEESPSDYAIRHRSTIEAPSNSSTSWEASCSRSPPASTILEEPTWGTAETVTATALGALLVGGLYFLTKKDKKSNN